MSEERLGLPSASSFSADVLCLGRRNLIRTLAAQGVPDHDSESPSEAASRGTRIHRALETDQTFELTDDELAAYNGAVRTKMDVVRRWQEDFAVAGFNELPREARIWLHHPESLAPMMSGQLDAHWLSDDGKHICIADYKSGQAVGVEGASVAWQLRAQALLAWTEYGKTAQRIRVAFIKPEAREELDWCDFTVWDLQNIEKYVHHVLWQTQQPDAPLRAGDHCQYCPARGSCPAALRYAMTPIPSLQVAPASNGKISKKIAADMVEAAPIEAVREVYGKRTAIEYIMAAVKARLAALPEEERQRLGLVLRPGRSTDFVLDVRGAVEALEAAGFPSDAIWGTLALGKGDAVKMVQQFKGCSEADAEKFFDSTLDPFIQRGRGSPILAEV